MAIPETGKYRMELQDYMLNGHAVKERWAFQLAAELVQLTEGESLIEDFIYRSYQETIN